MTLISITQTFKKIIRPAKDLDKKFSLFLKLPMKKIILITILLMIYLSKI